MIAEFSIEVVILVAVGGRGTLSAPILGAVLVNFGKTYLQRQVRGTSWPIILGGLFILVVVLLPEASSAA